ncbi:MAG TPA: penicillin-binding transpeptidase domain-containing protein, partial [Cytophagaceae bacterium]
MFTERKNVIQLIFILVATVFVTRLFYIQVIDSSYKFEAQNNVMRRIVQYPYRGLIYDRNGKLLVFNTPVFDLMVISKEMNIKDTATFCEHLGMTVDEFKATFKKIRSAREYSPVKPIAFMKQLSITDYAKIQDFLVDYKGFYIQARTIRSYPNKTMANALGYIGEISKKTLESQEEKYYSQGDYIGISGIEAKYEKELRGRRGSKYKMVNVRGVEKGSFKNGLYDTISIPGQNLTTTIDLDLQMYGEKLMENKIGSVVAIEPSTGEILAIISSPSYDPNLLAGRNFSLNFNALQKDSLKPLFNRPLMAMYPPGSIFKLPQALVAMEMGVLKATTRFPCNGAIAMGV